MLLPMSLGDGSIDGALMVSVDIAGEDSDLVEFTEWGTSMPLVKRELRLILDLSKEEGDGVLVE